MGDLAMMRVSEGRATKDDWLCRGSILADVVFMQHLFFLFWLRWLHLTNPQGTKQGTKKALAGAFLENYCFVEKVTLGGDDTNPGSLVRAKIPTRPKLSCRFDIDAGWRPGRLERRRPSSRVDG